MQNKKLIILIVLGTLAVISLIRGILTPSKIRRQIASQTAQEVVIQKRQPPTTVKEEVVLHKGARRTKYTTWGRNPFVSAKVSGRISTGLLLNGILWDKKTPMAIINDKMVGIGDKIEGNAVVDIKPSSVILNDGTNDFELKLGL